MEEFKLLDTQCVCQYIDYCVHVGVCIIMGMIVYM